MIPLFTSEQIRGADSYAIKQLGIPGSILMENASISIYNRIKQAFPELVKDLPIGILAGKGNNGGDAFALARHFANAHYPVVIISIAGERELKGDAALNFSILKKLSRTNKSIRLKKYSKISDLRLLDSCQLIIDGLLGTGSKGELREPYKSIVQEINKINNLKAAIDIPTGLNVDTGFGEVVFDADVTITLAELKRGLFFGSGYVYSGEIFKGRIGLPDEYFKKLAVTEYLVEPEDAFAGIPERKINAHKYSAGKVLAICGSAKYQGAASIAANSSLIGGAGAVILAVPKSISNYIYQNLEGAVINPYNDSDFGFLLEKNVEELTEKIDWADVICLGPGLGREEATKKAVLQIVGNNPDKYFVIDADAIAAFSLKEFKKFNLSNAVFTPHFGEFASLMNISIEELKRDILGFGKKFSKLSGAYLALKGAPTIIFTPTGEALINSSGNPGLAKFGSGDVLTGLVSAFIAQNKQIEKSLISAIYVHGMAADLYSEDYAEIALTATRLIDYIPNAVKFIHDTFV